MGFSLPLTFWTGSVVDGVRLAVVELIVFATGTCRRDLWERCSRIGWDRQDELGRDPITCARAGYQDRGSERARVIIVVGDAAAAVVALYTLGFFISEPENTVERRCATGIGGCEGD